MCQNLHLHVEPIIILITNSYTFSVFIITHPQLSRKKNGKTRRKTFAVIFHESGRVKYSQLRNEKHVTKTSSAIQWHFVEREVNKIQENLALISHSITDQKVVLFILCNVFIINQFHPTILFLRRKILSSGF